MSTPHDRLMDSLESSATGLTLDFNRPPPKKTRVYDSLEEMLTELGIKERRERPNTLGKAELHTSFWTSGDPKLLTWYNNRDADIDCVEHHYSASGSFDTSLPPLGVIVVLHPHTFDEPCWAKYKCRLLEGPKEGETE